jgi:hypothetical protein
MGPATTTPIYTANAQPEHISTQALALLKDPLVFLSETLALTPKPSSIIKKVPKNSAVSVFIGLFG